MLAKICFTIPIIRRIDSRFHAQHKVFSPKLTDLGEHKKPTKEHF